MRMQLNITAAASLAFSLSTASPALAAEGYPAPEAAESATVLTGYGEINYTHPTRTSDTQIDLRRFVVGFQHRFDEKTKLVTEIEVEHAVSSATDQGEVEIEQAFVERQLFGSWAGRAGLFLIPLGLLNEHHEPTAYYGVERNFVETAIIPSTWREGGVELVGTFESGLTLNLGVSSTMDLNKWDATSTEGRASPLGSIHQELQLARAHDLGGFVGLDWRGLPGFLLGGAVFAGNSSQGQPGTGRAVIAIWDVHARLTPGPVDLSAVYTRGTISGTAAFNNRIVVENPGATTLTLVPEAFDGWYVQGAIHAWSHRELALAPFVRYERFNTARKFADLGPGVTVAAAPTEAVLTAGLNFNVTSGVVLKADVQRFQVATNQDRVDLGLGWSF